jgi:hypothetical protein
MDRTAYNDILEANLNNNLQEHDDIDQQIKIITDALIDAQKKTTPNKITQLRGPKWKASSPVEFRYDFSPYWYFTIVSGSIAKI